MTKPSGVLVCPDTGKSRVSSWRGAYVVLMIFTPGALTGTMRGDRVVLLAGLHRLGRDRHQLVAERRAGDVQLGAADDDAVGLAVDDVDVGVRVVLLAAAGGERSPLASVMHWVMRMSRACASSMNAWIRSMYCGAPSLIRPPRRGQGHDRRVGDVGHHPGLVHEVDLLAQLLGVGREPAISGLPPSTAALGSQS